MQPAGRASIPVRCLDLSPLFATLTQTPGCVPKIPILETSSLPAPPRGTLVGLQTVNYQREEMGTGARGAPVPEVGL